MISLDFDWQTNEFISLNLCALIIQKVISNSLDITFCRKKFFQLLLEQSKQRIAPSNSNIRSVVRTNRIMYKLVPNR